MIFNVKKTGSACAVAVALFAASWGAHATSTSATAASAAVNFKATVTDQTCTPSWDATKGVDVDFQKVSLEDLKAVGDIGSYHPFTLKLTSCKNVAGVKVTASGASDKTDSKAFANTAADQGAATNVAFVLMGGADLNTRLAPDLGEAEYKMAENATSIDMPFLAELEATGQATAGPASGAATLYMTYE